MEVSTYNFDLKFKGNELNATCQKMKVYKRPHLRVALNREKDKTDIYIFHEINERSKKYFWFELTGIKQELAKIIVKKLEEVTANLK